MLNMIQKDIDSTWEYAVRNEQYSPKNNVRLLGLEKEPDENLEAKFIAAKTMERRLSQRKLKSYIELVLEE